MKPTLKEAVEFGRQNGWLGSIRGVGVVIEALEEVAMIYEYLRDDCPGARTDVDSLKSWFEVIGIHTLAEEQLKEEEVNKDNEQETATIKDKATVGIYIRYGDDGSADDPRWFLVSREIAEQIYRQLGEVLGR